MSIAANETKNSTTTATSISTSTSTLQALKITAAKRAIGNNPQVHRRLKLSRKIWEQIELARAQAAGQQFTMKKFRTVTDPDGVRKSVEIPRRVRAWWWTTETNKVALNIRYGARAVEFSKGKSSVEMATAADLIPTLELIKRAVEAGELDAQIEAASLKLREGFKK